MGKSIIITDFAAPGSCSLRGIRMQYDVAAKVVVQHGKEAILKWFLHIDPEEVELLEEIPQESVSLRRSDFPLWVKTKDGKEKIVLLEFQTRWERDVPIRLLEYHVRFLLRYHLPVVSVLILFRRREGIEGVYEDESIRFRYHLIKMWQMKAEEVLERGEIWLYPFVPVMEGGIEEIYKAEEGIYRSDLSRGDKADLLTALAIFSGFKGEQIVRELLRRRRDIMIESPAYEIIKEEGIREGLQQGLQQGMLEDAREMVLRAFGVRFKVVPPDIEEKVRSINSRATLVTLHEIAITCKDPDEFREALKIATGG